MVCSSLFKWCSTAGRFTFIAIYRANNNSSDSSSSSVSSKTPVSITKNLSDLRLAHAQLLEEHGANVALLRRREAEIGDLERRERESQLAVESLQTDVRGLKEKVGRREQRVILAEREVGFLNALVVLTLSPFLLLYNVLMVVFVYRRASMQRKRTVKVPYWTRPRHRGFNSSKSSCKNSKILMCSLRRRSMLLVEILRL
jgi:transposase-like protein